jgi:ABC-2 type transport system permease protein
MREGKISIGILIPPDFERRRLDPDRATAQLLVDASDPVIFGAAGGLAGLPLFVPERRAPRRGRPPSFETRAYYNPERRSQVQIVPGLIGVILTLTMSLFTAVAIVRERERGTLELLINTPVRTAELMVGKIIPHIVIGLVQVTLILGVGATLFRVPIRGPLLDLYGASLLFVAATLGLGLLISTVAKTQFQAFQLVMFFFLPSMLLSGFMFPFDGMPAAAQRLGDLLPLTHFLRLVRGIVLRGASLAELRYAVWPLLVFFVITLRLATLRFRKRLD